MSCTVDITTLACCGGSMDPEIYENPDYGTTMFVFRDHTLIRRVNNAELGPLISVMRITGFGLLDNAHILPYRVPHRYQSLLYKLSWPDGTG